uniref:Uncharacterized protein n=2 Tax=unclassified bacterial viruses TaxID=12333 RepID=A0AAU6VY03_9VIRU
MDINLDYVKLLELQVDALARAVLNTSRDLVRAGMSEYNPEHSEMIEMGSWGLGLFEVLGIDTSKVTDWQADQHEDRP